MNPIPASFSTLAATLATVGLVSAQTAQWLRRTPANAPVGASTMSMAFDPARNRTVLHVSGRPSETWDWDGAQWSQRSTRGPIHESRLVHDPVHGRLLFVATEASSGAFATWTLDGAQWSILSTPHEPIGRSGFGLAFDGARGVAVLFGGSRGGEEFSDTWEFDGNDWVQRSSGGPPMRESAAMVYDPDRGVTLLFGGYRDDPSPLVYGDTWEWDGAVWRESFGIAAPPTRTRAGMTYDSLNRRALLFGGRRPLSPSVEYDDTWAWDGLRWTALPAAPRPPSGHALAFDPVRGVAVLFVAGQGAPGQTWEFHDAPARPGAFTPYGQGCGGAAGVPDLASTARPTIGQTFTALVTDLPTGVLTRAIGLLGTSRTDWQGTSLPLGLGFLGMPGCSLLVGPEDAFDLPRAGTAATWDLAVPFDARLIGAELFQQALVIAPGANAAGVIVSNAGRLTIGN
jgi:hypothetical protein